MADPTPASSLSPYVPPLPASAPAAAPTPAPSSPSAPSPSAPRNASRPHWSDQLPRPAGSPTPQQRGVPGEPGAEPSGPDAPRPAPAAPSDGSKIKVGDREYTRDEWNAIEARAALEASRAATLPATAADYKDTLPADFKTPANLQFEINPNDPLIAQYKTLAHSKGFSQSDYSDGLGLIAAYRVNEAAQFAAARAAEVEKLGSTASDRVTAVTRWLSAMGGPKAGALTKVLTLAPVADTIEALEHLMQVYSSQGISRFNQSGRSEPRSDGKIPGYSTMSFEQRRHAQTLQAQRRGDR